MLKGKEGLQSSTHRPQILNPDSITLTPTLSLASSIGDVLIEGEGGASRHQQQQHPLGLQCCCFGT